MTNGIGIRRIAAIVLAGIALTQLAACGTTPRVKPKPLTYWSSPEDCTTDYAAAVSGVDHEKGAPSALLVDSIGTVWNCTTISEGRYDATVVVRWSNGWQETALDVQGIEVAAGQTLIAKAFQQGRGVIPASFGEFKIGSVPAHVAPDHVAPLHATSESVTPAPALEPQSGRVPASETATPATAPDSQPEQSSSPAAPAATESPHPAMTALKIAAAVVIVAGLVVLTRGNLPLNFSGGGSQTRSAAPYVPQRTGPAGRPSADCCFVWIEDGATGAVVAGNRPVQN